MPKKLQSKSRALVGRVKKMSTEELKKELIAYDELINGDSPCYGVRDIFFQEAIIGELTKRGIKIKTKIVFN
jgi:hypothetical protein